MAVTMRHVQFTRDYRQPPEVLWSYVGDFAGQWHPVIAQAQLKITPSGRVSRVFQNQEGQSYAEQLVYLSHSDRLMRYTLDSGIQGLNRYLGTVRLTPSGPGTRITWGAEIDASSERIEAIAEGTSKVLQAGLDWLETASMNAAAPVLDENSPCVTKRRFVTGAVRTGFLTGASGDADTLVLCLHGIGGNAENWLPQIEAFGAQYKMAALNFRGYGDSDLGPHRTTIEDYCKDILSVIRASGAKRVVLVGLSMGAWVATSFAMRYPKKLAGLVLAGGCTGLSEATETARKSFFESRATPLSHGKTPADFAPDVVSLLAGKNATQSARDALMSSMSDISSETYTDALSCFCNPQETFNFSQVACPVLMMTGSEDVLAPPSEIRSVARRIFAQMRQPDVRFEVLPDTGHVCNLEAPALFNAHLGDFLARIKSAQLSTDKRTTRRVERSEKILSAALAEFSKNGTVGASMDAIADRAGVSKPTLYSYFHGKDKLFDAVLKQGLDLFAASNDTIETGLIESLWAICWARARVMFQQDVLTLSRLVIGQAARRPDAARALYESCDKNTEDMFARCFDAAEFPDPASNAELLFSLTLGALRAKCLHNPSIVPSDAMVAAAIFDGLRNFLNARTPEKSEYFALLDRLAHRQLG